MRDSFKIAALFPAPECWSGDFELVHCLFTAEEGVFLMVCGIDVVCFCVYVVKYFRAESSSGGKKVFERHLDHYSRELL